MSIDIWNLPLTESSLTKTGELEKVGREEWVVRQKTLSQTKEMG